MKEQIIEILNTVNPGVDYEKETKLIDSRILDSLSIISLVSELSFAFDVEIDVMDLVPENLNSVDAIVELISELQG
ncbi:phosphopantetheine-binding protein [Tannockella kyphosi]|uniref:phosphopantetheine-binding protein n=1 Tax=Tannockella kyphosi TaxID=2899121 RepID=UPI0020135072|nr:phosphopantetheine-binding protein [Tannockella kyphosi]